MRDARARARDGRGVLAALLLGGYCLCGWGCHHHHYYYGASAAGPCPPAVGLGTVISSNVVDGPVCEVPTEVEGAIAGSHSTIVDDGRGKARVLVSKPDRRSSRLGWRSSNPEDVPAFTQIDGAVRSTVK